MSKQSEAKESQGYNPTASQRVCGTCGYFTCTKEIRSWAPKGATLESNPEWATEKNLRCALGGFSVKKLALCNEWVKKPESAE